MYRWHILDPIRFEKDLKVTIQDLGWRNDGRYLDQKSDISSVVFWYQTEPHAKFPTLPSVDDLEIVNDLLKYSEKYIIIYLNILSLESMLNFYQKDFVQYNSTNDNIIYVMHMSISYCTNQKLPRCRKRCKRQHITRSYNIGNHHQ